MNYTRYWYGRVSATLVYCCCGEGGAYGAFFGLARGEGAQPDSLVIFVSLPIKIRGKYKYVKMRRSR